MATKIAFSNLRAEMGRKNLAVDDLAVAAGIRRETMSRKLCRKSCINLDEAMLINKKLFPNCSVEYLFTEIIGDFPMQQKKAPPNSASAQTKKAHPF